MLAPILLPRRTSLRRCDACPSTPPSFFCPRRQVGSSQIPSSSFSCSCFAVHFFQYISRLVKSIFFTLRPLDAHATGLAHDGSCKSSDLSPHLNLKNLLSPCLFLHCIPYTNTDFFCPNLRSHCGQLFFHFETRHFQENGKRSRPLLARCWLPSVSSNLNFLWAQFPLGALPTLLLVPDTLLKTFSPNFHVTLLKALLFFMNETLTLQFLLLAFSFAPVSTLCHRHSFLFTALLKLFSKWPHEAIILLFASFPFSVIDDFRPFSSTSSLHFCKRGNTLTRAALPVMHGQWPCRQCHVIVKPCHARFTAEVHGGGRQSVSQDRSDRRTIQFLLKEEMQLSKSCACTPNERDSEKLKRELVCFDATVLSTSPPCVQTPRCRNQRIGLKNTTLPSSVPRPARGALLLVLLGTPDHRCQRFFIGARAFPSEAAGSTKSLA